MIFTTLATIVEDLLLIIRGSNISRSEPISKRQLEDWVHQYRALLIKQDIDKGRNVNPDYIQTIPVISIEKEDTAGGKVSIDTGNDVYRTTQQLPKTLDFHFKSGIISVSTLNDEDLQLVPSTRRNWQQYKTWTNKDTLVYLKDQYLYLINPKGILYLKVRGIFENPMEAAMFTNSDTIPTSVDASTPYPIPVNMVPVLKQMILERELKILINMPTDNINNTADDLANRDIERKQLQIVR